jgi:tRNA (adenine37-N6)-methyltransferase
MPEVEPLALTPIGHIRTPYVDRYRAPRQPGAGSAAAEGTIVLLPGKNFEQALEDLDGFERIWIVYWFHLNKTWKPKVLPPRGSKRRRGVFATRSPHRPNPIGLSLVRLLEVKGRTLRVSGVDLLDGTPILDLKPYLAYAEAFPDARAGWLEEKPDDARDTHFTVEWSPLARQQAKFLEDEFGIRLTDIAGEILRRDAEPHPYRRISAKKGGLTLAVKSWRIHFSVRQKCVSVERIASGYSSAALNEAKPARPLHDHAAHAAFHARWPQR